MGVNRPVVSLWENRFLQAGLVGLADAKGRGPEGVDRAGDAGRNHQPGDAATAGPAALERAHDGPGHGCLEGHGAAVVERQRDQAASGAHLQACNQAQSSTTSGSRRCWSRSKHSRPPTRRISNGGIRPGGGRPTTSKRRVRPRRGERHATLPSRRRPEAANPIEG